MAIDSLAAALRDELDRRGLTGEQAAELLGVSQPTVSRWLGGSPPDDDRIDALAVFLHLEVESVERLVFQARRAQRDHRRRAARPPDPPASSAGEDEIEIDYNSAIANMPEEVRQAVLRIVKPYLDEEQ